MKINVNEETQIKALEALKGENKEEAIVKAVEILNAANNEALISQILKENNDLSAGKQHAEKLGLRSLSNEETSFYQLVAKQGLTSGQEDTIPTTIIDRTLDDIKKSSKTMNLIQFAPAGVKKWISASKTGKASWGALSATLTNELTASITSMNMEVNKLYAYLIIPKSIRELALPFVDKYVRAILAEAMRDGLIEGYIVGTGTNQPIGITRQLKTTNSDGTKKEKTVNTLTGFSPKELAVVKKYLSKNGVRETGTLYLIANPTDVYQYIEPALYLLTPNGYLTTSKSNIEVIEEPNCPAGKAVITIDQAYTMGMSTVQTTLYKETKALDDADVLIAKTNANGQANDDNTAYVIDPTKLVEAVLKVNQAASPETT